MAVPRNPYGWAIPGTQAWKNAQLMNNSRNSFNNNPYLPWNRGKKPQQPQTIQAPAWLRDPKTIGMNKQQRIQYGLQKLAEQQAAKEKAWKNSDLFRYQALATYQHAKNNPSWANRALRALSGATSFIGDCLVWSKDKRAVAAGMSMHAGRDISKNSVTNAFLSEKDLRHLDDMYDAILYEYKNTKDKNRKKELKAIVGDKDYFGGRVYGNRYYNKETGELNPFMQRLFNKGTAQDVTISIGGDVLIPAVGKELMAWTKSALTSSGKYLMNTAASKVGKVTSFIGEKAGQLGSKATTTVGKWMRRAPIYYDKTLNWLGAQAGRLDTAAKLALNRQLQKLPFKSPKWLTNRLTKYGIGKKLGEQGHRAAMYNLDRIIANNPNLSRQAGFRLINAYSKHPGTVGKALDKLPTWSKAWHSYEPKKNPLWWTNISKEALADLRLGYGRPLKKVYNNFAQHMFDYPNGMFQDPYAVNDPRRKYYTRYYAPAISTYTTPRYSNRISYPNQTLAQWRRSQPRR